MHRNGDERRLLGCGAGEDGKMTRWGEIKCPRCEELEGKLAKLTKAADRVHDSYWYSSDGIIVGMHDLSEALREARTILAELKGQDDE